MAKQYDATMKVLLEECPADWVALAGLPAGRVEVIDADVSTVTIAADKVVRVSGPPDWIMHLELQAGPDATLPRRTHTYNAVLEDKHQLPVASVVVLLRPEANLRVITGVYERQLPGQVAPYLSFRYQVIRVWHLPVERMLTGGLGTLPLAPISDVDPADVPGVIRQMKDRLGRVPDRSQAARLWAATYILMGLRYDEAFTERLFQEVLGMEESVTYQAIIRKGEQKGRLEEARKILVRLGQKHLGTPPPPEVRKALDGIEDVARLEELTERALSVSSWAEVLTSAAQQPPRRKRKKKS